MADVVMEHEWLAAHPHVFEEYVGKWIAVAGKKVVASAESIRLLRSQLSKMGLERPLIMLVPRKDEEFSLL